MRKARGSSSEDEDLRDESQEKASPNVESKREGAEDLIVAFGKEAIVETIDFEEEVGAAMIELHSTEVAAMIVCAQMDAEETTV